MLAHYADLHHRILTDALSWYPRATKYPETPLQPSTLSTLENIPSDPKLRPPLIQPVPGKKFEKAVYL